MRVRVRVRVGVRVRVRVRVGVGVNRKVAMCAFAIDQAARARPAQLTLVEWYNL